MTSRTRIPRVPPDGGWGWVVTAASLGVLTLRTGVTWVAFPILYADLVNYFDTSTASVGWVASTFIFSSFAVCLVASPFLESHGSRIMGIVSTLVGSTGLVLSSLSPNLPLLCISYGLITGCGVGCTAFASLIPTQEYFSKRRPIAAGISSMGVGLGQIVFPPLIRYMLDEYGWRGTMLLNAGINLHCAILCAAFRPLGDEKPGENHLGSDGVLDFKDAPEGHDSKVVSRLMPLRQYAVVSGSNQDITLMRAASDSDRHSHYSLKGADGVDTCQCKQNPFRWMMTLLKTNVQLASDSRILLYLLGNFLCNYGLWTLYTHYTNRAQAIGVGKHKAAMLMSVVGVANVVGRLVICGLSTLAPGTNRVALEGVCFLFGGVLTMMVAATRNFMECAIVAALCGTAAGGALGLQITALVDLAGVAKASRAAGILLAGSGAAVLLALPLGGWLYDVTGSYSLSFIVNGGLEVLGACSILVILCCNRTPPRPVDITIVATVDEKAEKQVL